MTARAKSARVGLPARVAETPLSPQPLALVLFGQDGDGKPRAAWFEAADIDAATAAAVTMRLRALPLTVEEGRELAAQLPRGRVLPSGRALVPFAKRDLYAQLIALAGEDTRLAEAADGQTVRPNPGDAPSADPPAGADGAATTSCNGPLSVEGEVSPSIVSEGNGAPPAPRPATHLFVGQRCPRDRAEIGLSSVVLAHEGPDDGWWEAEVIGANGSTFSLRWCDYPAEPTILRKADELALLPPGKP
jgi:hypothetical protein